MNKSDFYIIWYSNRGYDLSSHGYPMVPFAKFADPENNDPNFVPSNEPTFVETEEDWIKFLTNEVEVTDLCRLDKDACDIAGVEFQIPYEKARTYPSIGDQLDNIYKTLKTLKDFGIDLGEEGNAYVDSITSVKETYPKN